jgi:hypothetical protein
MRYESAFVALMAILPCLLGQSIGLAGTGDADWMLKAKYGLFMHYQYRILLGYSVATDPKFPGPSQMSARQWNQFVDGFDVKGFARQAAEARVGWVMFCLDDHYFAWPCAPNQAFSKYTGYAPGEKCSRRDLILDLADALNAKGVKLIVYFAGLNGYTKEPQVSKGLVDDGDWATAPSAESRKRRLEVLKEFADRYKGKIAGWWFDGIELNSYADQPNDWSTINAIVHAGNPRSVIAFSYGPNEQARIQQGIDDYTGGDTWSKVDLTRLTPNKKPAQGGILWHGKIYCGNVYHGMGTANQYTDQYLIDWIAACNRQGGVVTLDWPFDPQTGLLKDFGFAQLKRIAQALKPTEPGENRSPAAPAGAAATPAEVDRRDDASPWGIGSGADSGDYPAIRGTRYNGIKLAPKSRHDKDLRSVPSLGASQSERLPWQECQRSGPALMPTIARGQTAARRKMLLHRRLRLS